MSPRSLLLSLLAPLWVLAQYSGQPQNSSIQWSDCGEGINPSLSCGTLPVPLDYTNIESGEKLNLSLYKVKAVKEPFMGSILINPGGPGLDAGSFLNTSDYILLVMTGGHFDIIGVDPRATGITLPVQCYTDPLDRFRADALVPPSTNTSDVAIGTTWAVQKTFVDTCSENIQNISRIVGTAFTARDMMQVVDALGEDGMLRYWGQSYGTVLGSTLAAMFPERIDKMVMDGVANIHEYTEGWEYEAVPAAEEVLDKWTQDCVEAGQPGCALAYDGVTAKSLSQKIRDLVEQIKFESIVLGSNVTTGLIGFRQILEALDAGLRTPIITARPFASYLDAIFQRNATAFALSRKELFPAFTSVPTGADGLFAIRCSDSKFRANSIDDIKPRVAKMAKGGSLFGPFFSPAYVTCSQWGVEAKGRYEGDFTAKTKNPIMFIGSPWDMRTPIVGAKNVSSGFEGSVVLQHNGLGHCVLYSPGQCAIKAMQEYFTQGVLPEPGTVCEQDFSVFSGKKISDSFNLTALTSS